MSEKLDAILQRIAELEATVKEHKDDDATLDMDKIKETLEALVEEKVKAQAAGRALVALGQTVGRIDPSMLEGRSLRAWQSAVAEIEPALESHSQAADLDQLRERFEPISEALLRVVDAFGHTRNAALHRAFCPMAFDNKGAAWLQAGEKIANPYFGHKMLRCGEIQREFPPVGSALREDDRAQHAREEGAHDH